MFVRIIFVTFLVMVLAWSVLIRSSGAAGSGEPYRVRAGDTLWSIAAARYSGDPREGVWAIQRENGLQTTALSPGQVLVLP